MNAGAGGGTTRSEKAAESAGTSVEPIIALDGLCFSSTDRRGKTIDILSNFTLKVAPNEFVAIVGPSGCGKSTAMNFMAPLLVMVLAPWLLGERPRWHR